ncbi:MAG: I78 family peptidase inhibitor [Propylenella sp.]
MRLSIIAAAGILAACTVQPNESEGENEMAAAESSEPAPAESNVVTEPVETEPGEPPYATPIGPPPEGADECGASNYQNLVGQPRSRIPEKPENANWRIACTTCPVTMDYSPARMNIFYDEETDVIEEVKCG